MHELCSSDYMALWKRKTMETVKPGDCGCWGLTEGRIEQGGHRGISGQ